MLSLDQRPLFRPGRIYLTVGAQEALARFCDDHPLPKVMELLIRHLSGDWGDLDAQDKTLNRAAVQDGGRILSAYQLADDLRIWIITEGDRSATTLLLPEEY